MSYRASVSFPGGDFAGKLKVGDLLVQHQHPRDPQVSLSSRLSAWLAPLAR
jgi:hypothetical protein